MTGKAEVVEPCDLCQVSAREGSTVCWGLITRSHPGVNVQRVAAITRTGGVEYELP